MAAAQCGAGEHQQVVAVAAHAGREMVQAEQALQAARVVLVTFEVLDQCQLLLDQRLASARERFEHIADLQP